MNPNQILQPVGWVVRGVGRGAQSIGQTVGNEIGGIFGEARGYRSAPKPDMDDVTLARKVESEIFRGNDSPKGAVNVNVVDGVVWLRGEVKHPEDVRELEAKALAIPEVRQVENLLHLPKTPAPTRADTPRRQQRTRSSTKRPTPRRTGGRVSDDHVDAVAPQVEPSPVEHAAKREGRTPAPLGSTGEDDDAPATSS